MRSSSSALKNAVLRNSAKNLGVKLLGDYQEKDEEYVVAVKLVKSNSNITASVRDFLSEVFEEKINVSEQGDFVLTSSQLKLFTLYEGYFRVPYTLEYSEEEITKVCKDVLHTMQVRDRVSKYTNSVMLDEVKHTEQVSTYDKGSEVSASVIDYFKAFA